LPRLCEDAEEREELREEEEQGLELRELIELPFEPWIELWEEGHGLLDLLLAEDKDEFPDEAEL
jgi:hypothetical protein